jgi:muramoyltetrapeptide carboxypeptidase
MNIIKPHKLQKGDTISIIAPAGNVDEEKILNSVSYFEQKGYRVKLGQNIFKKDRYMAGTDEERLSDLVQAFLDKEVSAIICARGGYGSLRLIDKINYDIIRQNPKIFCGYSDITALSLVILKNTGLVTYSSPMPKGDFQSDSIDEFSEKCFWQCITEGIKEISTDCLKIYNDGCCQGILWGGNLATVASLCGIDFIPDEKFIFFAEDLNEPVYKIDRCFRQLLNIGKFRKNVAGIVLGDFLDTEYPEQLDTLFKEIAIELNIPVYGGYKITHAKSKLTIPIGETASLDNNGKLFLGS